MNTPSGEDPTAEGGAVAPPQPVAGTQGAEPRPVPRWRRLAPQAAAFALGAALAGTTAHWLGNAAAARQAERLAAQEAEVARLKGVLAGYDTLLLQSRRRLEEEQGRRLEAENRLARAQADLARRAAAPPAGAGRSIDCTLHAGRAGHTLKDCLEAFNR